MIWEFEMVKKKAVVTAKKKSENYESRTGNRLLSENSDQETV